MTEKKGVWPKIIARVSSAQNQATGLLVTSILAVLGIAWTDKGVTVQQVCILFFLTMFFMLIHSILLSKSVDELMGKYKFADAREGRLQRKIQKLMQERDNDRRDVIISDKAFRDLALKRTAFENKILAQAFGSDPEKIDRMSEAVVEYLVMICDACVNIFAAREHTQRDQFHSNIKIVSKSESGHFYKTIARSPNTSASRAKKNDEYPILSNEHFNRAMRSDDRCHIINDLPSFVKEYQSINERGVTGPPIAAQKYYMRSLSVLIYIKPRTQNQIMEGNYAKNAYESVQEDMVYGFITIDSPSVTFKEADMDIIEEMGIHALSALRIEDILCNVVNSNPDIGKRTSAPKERRSRGFFR